MGLKIKNHHIYRIPLDSKFDLKIKDFESKLANNEKIIQITTDEGFLIILTEENKKEPSNVKNLLLEEFKKRSESTEF